MARSVAKVRRSRLNMRIPADLLGWAKDFVAERNTNLTQLFVDHLTTLREKKGKHGGKASEHR